MFQFEYIYIHSSKKMSHMSHVLQSFCKWV